MNIDYEMGNGYEFMPGSPSQLPSSQWHTRDADTDLVKWQGSQTSSVALNALMKEAAKPIRRSPRNHGTQRMFIEPIPSFSGSSGSSSASTSGSNSSFLSKPRPPRPRTRHPSGQITSGSFLTSIPAPMIPSDPTQFLRTLKGISEKVKVDESARVKKRLSSGEVKGLGSTSTGMRISIRKEKPNLRRSTTGMKESDKSKSPAVGSRSLPIMGGEDMGDMEVDGGASFQIDVDMDIGAGRSVRPSPYDEHAIAPTSAPNPQTRRILPNLSSHMPPPPVPVPKVQPLPPPRDYPLRLTSNPAPIPAKPKSVSSQRVPPPAINNHPQSRPLPSPHASQQPSSSRPPNSQLTSRPPALGMRRSITTYSALAPSQTLPDKQRGFKVPLAKSAHPLAPVSSVQPPAPSFQRKNVQVSGVLPTPEPSPPNRVKEADNRDASTQHSSSSPAPDADSSYGDMSFDMDALEETMKKYD